MFCFPQLKVAVQIYITVVSGSKVPYDLAKSCGDRIRTAADNLGDLDLAVENCGNATYRPPCGSKGEELCPPGHIVKKGYCC